MTHKTNRLCAVFLGSANVVAVSARIGRPNDDAVLKCAASPATTVSAWYRNSSHGVAVELSHRAGGKYLLSNETLTVSKVGE